MAYTDAISLAVKVRTPVRLVAVIYDSQTNKARVVRDPCPDEIAALAESLADASLNGPTRFTPYLVYVESDGTLTIWDRPVEDTPVRVA